MRNKPFKTIIKFPSEYASEVERICKSISLKDESFKYKIVDSWYQPNTKVLIIYSKDKDKAFRRGEWMKHVLEKEYQLKTLYMVKK